jgi:hypothetical protein
LTDREPEARNDPGAPAAPGARVDGAQKSPDARRTDRPPRRIRRSLFRWSLLLAAGLLLPWIAGQRPETVERLYSKLVFPAIAAVLGWSGGLFPFSVAQIVVAFFVVALALSLLLLFIRLFRRDRVGMLGWLRAALAVLAIGVWSFEIVWGLNYARPPLARRLQLSEVDPTPERLASLTRWLADDTNRSYAMAIRTGEIRSGEVALADGATPPSVESEATRFLVSEADLLVGLDRAYRSVEPTLRNIGFSPPKRPRAAGGLLSVLGISGIYFPFTGEATVNSLMPPVSFPFTAAHEMAHQRGIAREDEANFMAFLACREAGFWCTRYGGSLGAYLRVRRALWRAEPDSVRTMGELLASGPQADVEAIMKFWAQYEGAATSVAEQVNDTYLKANRQKAGVASYDLMVQILVAFQEDGLLDPATSPNPR